MPNSKRTRQPFVEEAADEEVADEEVGEEHAVEEIDAEVEAAEEEADLTRTRAIPAGASVSACPQDLESIDGVGETYEQRLYAAGIGTFWEVGSFPQDELAEILESKSFQDVDLDAIQASALNLAEETGMLWAACGAAWSRTTSSNCPASVRSSSDDYTTRASAPSQPSQSSTRSAWKKFARRMRIVQANFTQWIEYARAMMD